MAADERGWPRVTADGCVRVLAQHLEWAEPRAGTFAFVRLRGRTGVPVDAEAYCDALRARAGLMLMPGTLFDHHEGEGAETSARAVLSSASAAAPTDASERVRLTGGRRIERAVSSARAVSDASERVRLTYGRKETPLLLERWAMDLGRCGVI